MEYASHYSVMGVPDNGYFAVYRATWKDSSGYFVRNGSVGTYFRLNSFYKTEGTLSNEFQSITDFERDPGVLPAATGLAARSQSFGLLWTSDVVHCPHCCSRAPLRPAHRERSMWSWGTAHLEAYRNLGEEAAADVGHHCVDLSTLNALHASVASHLSHHAPIATTHLRRRIAALSAAHRCSGRRAARGVHRRYTGQKAADGAHHQDALGRLRQRAERDVRHHLLHRRRKAGEDGGLGEDGR